MYRKYKQYSAVINVTVTLYPVQYSYESVWNLIIVWNLVNFF